MAAHIRILIADDHAMFREAIRHTLEHETDLTIVGEAADGAALVALVRQTPADVLLLDLSMPAMSGLEALRRLRQAGIAIRTIVLAGHISPAEALEALRLGVRGIVGKDASLDLLAKSVRHVAAGDYWVSHERTAELFKSVGGDTKRPAGPIDTLTPRECEMVRAVLRADSNREISRRFGIGEQTVKNHLSRIFAKLGVANRLELALFAITHHVAETPPTEP